MQFSDIIGQQEVKQHLVHTAKDDRISHAQLFYGPEGNGGLQLAIAYSKFILCENPAEDACGQCPSCLKVSKFSHPDLHFSYPIHLKKGERERSTDCFQEWKQINETSQYFSLNDWNLVQGSENKQGVIGTTESEDIVKKLSLKSFEGGYKILIIWLPEKMNQSASNKLLKLIEEPPAKTLFILVSEDKEQIITTILSRTQLVTIPRVNEVQIQEYLKAAKGLSEEDAHTVAHLAQGNVSEALNLIEHKDLAQFNFENFVDWMRMCYQRNVAKTMDWVDHFGGLEREKQKNFLKFCLHMFRQSIVGQYTQNELVISTPEQQAFLVKFAPFINYKNIIDLTEQFNDAIYHLERNANPKILFLDLSLKVFGLIRRNTKA